MRCVSLSAVVCTLCLAVAALVSLSSGRQATAAPEPAAAPMDDYKKPLLLNPRIQTEVLLSTSGKRQHRIIVSAPQGPAPKGGFPVIYVLDGDAWFGTAVEIAKMREYEKLDPAIVVGIGYPSHSFFDALGRSFDFTPPGEHEPRGARGARPAGDLHGSRPGD